MEVPSNILTFFVHKRDEISINLHQSIYTLLRYFHFIVFPEWGKIDDFRPPPLASGGLRLLPIMNTNKEITPIFLCEKIEKSILYLPHLDLSSKTEISIPFQAE